MTADTPLQTACASDIRVTCADGIEVAGTLTCGDRPNHAVLVSSGTGFPQAFYQPIAHFLAERGALVLTYDYRGIGRSATPQTLLTADLPDWGRLDMAACIDRLQIEAPDLPLFHIGHSVGGHLVGFAENHARIRRHAFIAVGSGTWWRHSARQWPRELYFWWGIGSANLPRHGYIKPGLGWTGEAVPGPAFRTWRGWSHRHAYYRKFIAQSGFGDQFDAVTTPIRSWVFSDDGIANPKTAQDIFECYPNAERSMKLTHPEEFGLHRIGHEGAFKLRSAQIWDDWRNWLLHGF